MTGPRSTWLHISPPHPGTLRALRRKSHGEWAGQRSNPPKTPVGRCFAFLEPYGCRKRHSLHCPAWSSLASRSPAKDCDHNGFQPRRSASKIPRESRGLALIGRRVYIEGHIYDGSRGNDVLNSTSKIRILRSKEHFVPLFSPFPLRPAPPPPLRLETRSCPRPPSSYASVPHDPCFFRKGAAAGRTLFGVMATMSFQPPFRLPNSTVDEAPALMASSPPSQWTQYDDLFNQLIDSDPDPFLRFGAADLLAGPTCGHHSIHDSAVGAAHAHDVAGACTNAGRNGSPVVGGGDSFAESQKVTPAVPLAPHVARCVSCEAPNKDSIASASLPFLPPAAPITPPLTDHNSSLSGSAKSDRVISGGVRKAYRKGSNSPRMAHPSFSRRNQTDWAQRLEAGADQIAHGAAPRQGNPWSPPSSDRIQQWDDNMAYGSTQGAPDFGTAAQPGRSGSFQTSASQYTANTPSRQQRHTFPSQRQTPSTTPYSTQGSTFDSLVASPQVEGSMSWDSGSISPFQPQYSMDGTPSSRQFDDNKVQPWWPPSAASYTNYSQPLNYQRQASHSDNMAQLPPQGAYGPASAQSMPGLGINTSGFGANSQPLYSASSLGSNSSNSYQLGNASRVHASPLPAGPPGAGHRHRSSSTESSSSPSSPGQSQSRSSAAASSRRTSRTHSANRRSKSQGGIAPAGGSKGAGVGFVNFTPSDSKKILTGVAPSGSSKTKARREKEAAERRRRLSQAAARAVIEAGGDPSALEREGLLGFG